MAKNADVIQKFQDMMNDALNPGAMPRTNAADIAQGAPRQGKSTNRAPR